MAKLSRTVTRARCLTCGKGFQARRADARSCSGRCRQRANRARQTTADIDLAIDEARRRYWALIRLKAEAQGRTVSHVLTDEAVTVRDGYVYKGGIGFGECIGQTTAGRPGWTSWGLEAAGPPFDPPDDERTAGLHTDVAGGASNARTDRSARFPINQRLSALTTSPDPA